MNRVRPRVLCVVVITLLAWPLAIGLSKPAKHDPAKHDPAKHDPVQPDAGPGDWGERVYE